MFFRRRARSGAQRQGAPWNGIGNRCIKNAVAALNGPVAVDPVR
jgi:hypothetical protein